MRYSKLFGKTIHNDPKDVKLVSHKLLLRGGFISESVAGRYYFLPLGWLVHDKIKRIIKEEMDRSGAQEMLAPTLHPLELWQETNRTNTAGFELLKVKDRRGAEFALGGTAEEMFVDVVRKMTVSYKDLPFTVYQFSNKFRDEMRARGGLLRVREFVMKDAYSFHTDDMDFKKEYEKMGETYRTIFKRLGLETDKVAADGGYIGGEYCHEFVVPHAEGEDKYFASEDGKYIIHEDIATFTLEEMNLEEELKNYEEVEAVRGNTMEDGVKVHNLPLWQQLKDVVYADEKGDLILAILRGDLEVNEVKLKNVTGAIDLRAATEEEIRAIGSEPGFISPVGLKGKVKIVADKSLRTVVNMYGGANKKNLDALNMNIDRDFQPDLEGDIAMVQDGYLAPDGKSKLVEKRGIEVGHVFQLGYHYSKKMKGAEFADKDGSLKPYYMGCYGIGLGRTMATIVEKYNDDKGIIWPESVAPFKHHLIVLGNDEAIRSTADQLYNSLLAKRVEVLYDDREGPTAGEKFADADLIGIPNRLVISKKTVAEESLEYKKRSEEGAKLIKISEFLSTLDKV